MRTLTAIKRDLRNLYGNLAAMRPLVRGPEGVEVIRYLTREARAIERELEHRLMLIH